MEALVSLAQFYKKQIPKLNFINRKYNRTQVQKLFNGIINGKISTADEAKKHVFGKEGKGDYRNLKRRLNQVLLNNLLYLNTDKWTENQQATYDIYKQYTVSRILVINSVRNTQLPIAERLLKKAIHYEMTSIVLDVARDLMMYEGSVNGDSEKYCKYREIVEKYSEINQIETKFEIYYSGYISQFLKTMSVEDETTQFLKNILKEMAPFHQRFKCSYKISLYYYSLMTYYYRTENDLENVIKTCEEAISFFLGKSYQMPYACYFHFSFAMIPPAIFFKEYDKVEALIDRCLKLPMQGSVNWLNTLRYFAIYAFHSDNPIQALDVLRTARKSPQFDPNGEFWNLVEGYLKLYEKVTRVVPTGIRLPASKFDNNFLEFQKDKQGYHAHIVIIEFFLKLSEKKYSELIDRQNAIYQYVQKHLKGEQFTRTKLFIKLLLKVIDYDFDYDQVQQNCDEEIKQLLGNAIGANDRNMNNEIVPYELLWQDVLMEMLLSKKGVEVGFI